MTDSRLDTCDWAAHQREAMAAYYAGAEDPAPSAADTEDPPLDEERPRPSGFAEWFALSQTDQPALLFLPGSQAFRITVRVGAVGISLYEIAIWMFVREATC